MNNKTTHFRMKLSTYRRIRRNFKGLRNETVAEYFERLSNYLIYYRGDEFSE